MKALLSLLGLLFLLATTVSAAALSSDSTAVSDHLSPTNIVAKDWEEEPFPQQVINVDECSNKLEPDYGFGVNATTCMCFNSGFASMRQPMIWAINDICNILQNVGLGPGGLASQAYTLFTTHWDIPIEIFAKVWWAGNATTHLKECEKATLKEGHGGGYKLIFDNCFKNFKSALDGCNGNIEDYKQGGWAVDRCFIYWLDPNDLNTGV